MKFSEKTYEELFHELYDDAAEKYSLTIEKVHDTMMHLKNDIFTLTMAHDMDTSWIYYTVNREGKTYLISNFINVHAEDVDREGIPKIDTIPKVIERTLIIQSRVIKRKFSELLKGSMEWFDEYKKSQFFHEQKLREF